MVRRHSRPTHVRSQTIVASLAPNYLHPTILHPTRRQLKPVIPTGDRNSSILLSIFTVRDDYRMKHPAGTAVPLA
jgi:hypothetical protein